MEKPETEPIAEEEEPEVENVGEVRRKVEKMSYKEGTLDEPLPSDIAKVVEKGDEKDEQDGEQEEKATEAKEDEGGLKRKALDRSQSSYIESEAEPKRPKDEVGRPKDNADRSPRPSPRSRLLSPAFPLHLHPLQVHRPPTHSQRVVSATILLLLHPLPRRNQRRVSRPKLLDLQRWQRYQSRRRRKRKRKR